jgi:hypothetical protein
VGSGHISLGCIDQEFAFQKFGYLDHGIVVFSWGFPELTGIDRYPSVDIIVQGQYMALEKEVPHETVEIVRFLSEFDIQIVGKDICYFIESFETAIVVYDSFCATKIGAEGQGAHSVGI